MPGDVWMQESMIGSIYECAFQSGENGVIPSIIGEAFVTSEAVLLFSASDPYRNGIRSDGA